jgi:hypothetical protein
MLNFLDVQGWANSAGFSHRRASLRLAPKLQENKGGDDARSV